MTSSAKITAIAVAATVLGTAAIGYTAGFGMTSRTLTGATAIASPASPAPSNQCTLTSSSTASGFADTYIDNSATGLNFGTTNIQVETKTNGNFHKMRGLLKFDLATARCAETGQPVASGKTIKTATLTLFANSIPSALNGDAIGVAPAGHSWAESTTTWGNADASLTGSLTSSASATLPSTGTTASVSWTVTSDVSNWYGGAVNNGWIMFDKTTTNTADNTTAFSSREDTAHATPTLVITW